MIEVVLVCSMYAEITQPLAHTDPKIKKDSASTKNFMQKKPFFCTYDEILLQPRRTMQTARLFYPVATLESALFRSCNQCHTKMEIGPTTNNP